MKPIQLPLVHIDKQNKCALVKSQKGNVFPVEMCMPEWKIKDIQYGDDAIVVKSTVTGEWIMIDYTFLTSVNYAIHNSYNHETGDLIYDENGELYE